MEVKSGFDEVEVGCAHVPSGELVHNGLTHYGMACPCRDRTGFTGVHRLRSRRLRYAQQSRSMCYSDCANQTNRLLSIDSH